MTTDLTVNKHTDEVASTADSCKKSNHPEIVKTNLTHRLNRIEGQIRGIKRMVEEDVYCDDIITQLSATQSALNSVATVLLEGHLKGCVKNHLADGNDDILDELLVTMTKLMRK